MCIRDSLMIEDNMNFNDVRNKLIQDTILNDVLSFSVLSKAMKYNQNIVLKFFEND